MWKTSGLVTQHETNVSQTHLAQTCPSTDASCRAGVSRGPRIQLSICPMLAVCASECVYVCQPEPCLSACSMFPAGRETERREGREMGGGGVVRELRRIRCWS